MSRPAPDRVRVSGPLASFADGFRVHLVEQGYSLWSTQFQLLLVAHLSRWMEAERLEVGQLTPPVVERFLAERRRQGYVTRLSPVGVRPLLGYLDRLGVLSAGEDVRTPVDRLVAEFRRYLLEERALAVGSVRLYEPVARVFLEERSEPIDADLAWFASESTPQIRVLIRQHLRGFRHLRGRGLDDRAGTFSRQCRRWLSTEAVSLVFAEV